MLRKAQSVRGPVILFGTLVVLLSALVGQSLAVQTATLQQRLRFGLKARTKAELAYVNQVVVLVQTGVLPRQLVDRVFFWARRKAWQKRIGSKTRRPLVYFRPALTILAARLGVSGV